MDAVIVKSSLIVAIEYQRITHYGTTYSVNCYAAPIALKVGIANCSIFCAEYAEATQTTEPIGRSNARRA